MFSTIVEKLETSRQNIIHFAKDLWFEDCKILKCVCNDIIDMGLRNFKDLLELDIIANDLLRGVIIEEYTFDSLECLLRLKLEGFGISEYAFKKLKNLKELSLIGNHKLVLNKNHFCGLENLEKLVYQGKLNEDLESLTNLRDLTLKSFVFDGFTFKGLEKLEKLSLIDIDLTPRTDKNLFKKLLNLKSFCFKKDSSSNQLNLMKKEIFSETFSSIPMNVKQFETDSDIFDVLISKDGQSTMPFLKAITSLKVIIFTNIDIMKCFQFNENLEAITLEDKSLEFPHNINLKDLIKLRRLQTLKFEGYILEGVDKEFTSLTEASFTNKIPENISNFVNLKKLSLKSIDPKLVLRENFLDDLRNLEELTLDKVFDSNDPDMKFLFKNLVGLKFLTINQNKMSILKSSYFEFLVNLEKLNLSANQIDVIESGSFSHLNKLKYLNLSSNGLKTFDQTFLYGLLDLTTLDLESNPIDFLKQDEFSSFDKLERVSLCKFFKVQGFSRLR